MFWIILGIIGVIIIAWLTIMLTKGFRHILVGGAAILIFLCLMYCGFLVFNRIVAPNLTSTAVVEKTELISIYTIGEIGSDKYCWGRKADDGVHYFLIKQSDKQAIELTSSEARLIFTNNEVPRVEHYHYYLDDWLARFMCGEYYCGDYAIIIPADGYYEE